MRLSATPLCYGRASGRLLKLDEPLSLWGGVSLEHGTIVDRSHPQCNESIAGRVLAMSSGRGSSSSSSALMELARSGLAPAAIVMMRHDPILVIGALVIKEIYQIEIPIVIVRTEDWPLLSANRISVTSESDIATVRIETPAN